MKFSVFLLMFLVGCSGDDNDQIRELRGLLKECRGDKESLEHALANTPSSSVVHVTDEAAEPKVEEIEAYKWNGRICKEGSESPCGASFWQCDDGMEYTCQQNVSYKLIKIKE